MVKLNLTAQGTEQESVLSYLQENANEILADKINNGVYIEKDGKRLLNKKDLNNFRNFAEEEALKYIAENERIGRKTLCFKDNVVYGWAIHYFEEDSLEGTLYNEDGTEYKKAVQQQTVKATTIPNIKKPKKNDGQMSFLPDIDEEISPSVPKQAAAEPTLTVDSANTQQVVNAAQDTATPKVTRSHAEPMPTVQTANPQVNSAELFYCKYEIMQKQYPEHILFYRLGDFYEALGNSAEKASRVLDLTLTGKNCGSQGRLPMCGIPYHALEIYVDKLRNKYDVALMHSDKDLELFSKKKFEDIVQENAEKMDALAEEYEKLGLVVDEKTDKKIDDLSAENYDKYFNLEAVTDKTTGEIKVPDVDKALFDILYDLFEGQIIMG